MSVSRSASGQVRAGQPRFGHPSFSFNRFDRIDHPNRLSGPIVPRRAPSPPRYRRHRRERGMLTGYGRLLLGLLVALTLIGALAARGVAAADAPMGNGAAVVAQGVSTMPSGSLVWRVIRDTAPTGDAAPVLERALGFAITENGPILIEDTGTGGLSQLGPGEAAFVPEGAAQRHVGVGEGPSSYVRIGLVDPVEADYTAGGDVLAVSDVFAAPAGARDIELSYAALDEGDEVTIAVAAGPVAVVVLSGEAESEGTEIATGDAAVVEPGGALTLTANADETAVYVAAIGPEVVVGGGPEVAQADPGGAANGTLTLDVFEAGCINDYPVQDLLYLQEQCNLPMTSRTVVVSTSAGEVGSTSFALAGDARMLAQFTNLPAGDTAYILGDDPANFEFRTMYCGDLATGEFTQPQNAAVQLPAAGGATCFIFYTIIGYGDGGVPTPETAPDANPNPNDAAGSGYVDLFEIGCDAVQPGLGFQELRATCLTQLPSRQVWLGTSTGESIATTAPMGAPAADMRATFDPVRAGNISLHLGGHEASGWVLVSAFCGNPNGGGLVPVQNPAHHALADGEYYACVAFYGVG